MDKQALRGHLELVIGDYLKTQGLELIELILRYEGRGLVLRVLTDKPEGGISLGECSSLNKEIGRILDEQDIIQEGYTLEVSSPGLDRPLAKAGDFSRCLNKRARFFLNTAVNGKIEWEGLILRVDQDALVIDTGAGELAIPLTNINKAKQAINHRY